LPGLAASVIAPHRRICKIADERAENIPTYAAVYRIVRELPKDLVEYTGLTFMDSNWGDRVAPPQIRRKCL
jgi:hypothetical protein